MTNLAPILRILGGVLCLLALSMTVPAFVDVWSGGREAPFFFTAAGITAFIGLALRLGAHCVITTLSVRQLCLSTTLCWVAAIFFAALPMAMGPLNLSLVNALFEATSGLTATNATILRDLDHLPLGVLLWRGMLQWMGGMGVIMTVLFVLPLLNVGGMQIFRIEVSAGSERALARMVRVVRTVVLVYVGLTILLAVALRLAGMGTFDSLVHAMTTISTGGFSTHDDSLAYFKNPLVDLIVTVGMIIGGLPFLLFFLVVQRQWRRIANDQQVLFYALLLGVGGLGLAGWLIHDRHYGVWDAIYHGIFTVTSVVTGTGFSIVDYGDWPGMSAAILFLLMFVGGCAGSASSGIKIFRFQLLLSNAWFQVQRLRSPNSVVVATYNKRPISDELLVSVIGFLFIHALVFAGVSALLALFGLDFMTAITGSAAAIANLGPGLGGTIGPGDGFADIHAGAKAVLIGAMVLGRLETLVVLVMVLPGFWRR